MTDLKNQVPDNIKFKEVTRDNLHRLFNRDFHEVLTIESLNKEGTEKNKDKEELGRYVNDKRLFVSFLMDPQSTSISSIRKSLRYDFLIGFLLFLASKKSFHYGFGYFKESQESFLDFIDNWNSFLDNLVSDINKMPELLFPDSLLIEINEFLILEVKGNSILSISLDYNKFERIFKVKSYQYEFRLMISENQEDKKVIEAGIGNGKGEKSGLYASMERFNSLIDLIPDKDRLYIHDTHEQE